MRRNLKKPVALLTAALTAASLLAGCGSSAGEHRCRSTGERNL
ncbi:MAG: hypothetical protein ACLVLH_04365 [Eisenbergiella massiliensis]